MTTERQWLDWLLEKAAAQAPDGTLARTFWYLVDRLDHLTRYELLQECAARGWVIPREKRLFWDYFEVTEQYRREQPRLDRRRAWLEARGQGPEARGQGPGARGQGPGGRGIMNL